MKIALCFIINYEHLLHKEELWREWIEPNKDIINVYFYYNDLKKIRSKWIMKHTIPPNCIYPTDYYHVIPAYLSVVQFAYTHDERNQWFCLLTDSCCPIISPRRFRYLFYNYYDKTIMNWRKAWWNTEFHKRANLQKLSEDLRLANDPWFVLKRENVAHCVQFVKNPCSSTLVQTVNSGGLANESLFAIILYCCKQLDNVVASATHMTDWFRRSSSTSPHMFKDGDEMDIQFIEKNLKENEHVMFIRKIHPEFPDEILRKYIYDYAAEKDALLVLREPFLKMRLYYYGLELLNWVVCLLPFAIAIGFYFRKEIY
jgi:hypothetical protein